jgi:hypothetical protein
MSGLVVCAACMRHVRKTEKTCPFCAEPLVARKLPEMVPFRRVAAAAAVATGVAAITGCTEGKRAQPFYGGPGIIEMSDDSGGSTQDDAAPIPLYGGPFPGFDAGGVRRDGSTGDARAADGSTDAPLDGADGEGDAAPDGTPDAEGDAGPDAAEQ